MRDQIELDKLCRQAPADAPLYQEIAGLLADTLASRRKTIRVSGMDLPRGTVRRRLRQLTSEHIRFVVEGLKQNRTQVRNPKQYILAALFNAPVSMYAKTTLDVGHGLSIGHAKRPSLMEGPVGRVKSCFTCHHLQKLLRRIDRQIGIGIVASISGDDAVHLCADRRLDHDGILIV